MMTLLLMEATATPFPMPQTYGEGLLIFGLVVAVSAARPSAGEMPRWGAPRETGAGAPRVRESGGKAARGLETDPVRPAPQTPARLPHD